MGFAEALTMYTPHEFPQDSGLPYFHNPYYRLPLQAMVANKLRMGSPNLVFGRYLIETHLWQHWGTPFDLQTGDVISSGTYYLELDILANKSDESAFRRLTLGAKELATFLKRYPSIDWIFGQTWLASVGEGRLVQRYGFEISPIPVRNSVVAASKGQAFKKAYQSARYKERVADAQVSLVYAHRDKYIKHWLE